MVPWDTVAFGFPVAQVDTIEIFDPACAVSDFLRMKKWADSNRIDMIACRLPHDKLRESMFLEEQGFRFVEMLYPAELAVQEPKETTWNRLEARLAEGDDLNDVLAVAGTVFRTERYYCDPRLNPEASDNRYCNWVKSTVGHHSQQLYVVKDGPEIVAFFVTEMMADACWYWHLNAVSPAYQGKGVGFAAAQKMIGIAIEKKARRIQTAFTARNHRALNLNARIGYRFLPPLMTFHWVRC